VQGQICGKSPPPGAEALADQKCKVTFMANSSPPGAEALADQKRKVTFMANSSPPGAEVLRNWWNNWWNCKKFLAYPRRDPGSGLCDSKAGPLQITHSGR